MWAISSTALCFLHTRPTPGPYTPFSVHTRFFKAPLPAGTGPRVHQARPTEGNVQGINPISPSKLTTAADSRGHLSWSAPFFWRPLGPPCKQHPGDHKTGPPDALSFLAKTASPLLLSPSTHTHKRILTQNYGKHCFHYEISNHKNILLSTQSL